MNFLVALAILMNFIFILTLKDKINELVRTQDFLHRQIKDLRQRLDERMSESN